MKNKLILRMMGLAMMAGLISPQAMGSTTDATVGTAGPGNILLDGDGRRLIDADGLTNPNVDGTYINAASEEAFATYAGRNASNETRMITRTVAKVEGAILNDRVGERINAALHNQSPTSQGLFAMGNGSGGLNAGDHMSKAGVWAMYGFSHIRNTKGVSDFRGNLHSGTFGVDYLFSPCFLAGLAFNYGRINDAKYSIRNGKYEHDSYTGALYAALIAHEYISFDAMIGYGKVHKKYREKQVARIVGDVLQLGNDGPDLIGRTYSRRFFGSIFANARYSVEQLKLWLRFGYSHIHDKEDSFFVADPTNVIPGAIRRPGGSVNIGNLNARLRAGYRIDEMVEPYIQAGLGYDVVRTKINADSGPTPNDKRFNWSVGGGANFFAAPFTAGIQYIYGKNGDLKTHKVTVDARYDF